jgi:hypothetical protein
MFNCYLLMLIGGLAGIAVFEACSGVLMGATLGLSSMAVSILFILPIPGAFFGAWFAGRQNARFSTLMWQAVASCLLAGIMMWIPGWFGVMTSGRCWFPPRCSSSARACSFHWRPVAQWSRSLSGRNGGGAGWRHAKYGIRRAGLVFCHAAADQPV